MTFAAALRNFLLPGFFFAMAWITPANGQNIQLHYDFGDGREYFTSTVEMFRPDDYGMTFFFIDFDYNASKTSGMSLAYWELARYIALPQFPGLSATLQYNDGLAERGPLGNTWLAGVSHLINVGGFMLFADVLYRHSYGADSPDGQLTFAWGQLYLDGKLLFTGYLDQWTADKDDETGKEMVTLSEPQLWYRLGAELSVGGELEVSRNFLPGEGWTVNPTLGLKWDF